MVIGLFYFLALLAIVSAANVLIQRRTMYAAMSLVVCFAAIAGIYFLLGARFIGVVQLIIYAGAIMVLFLIVVMLLDPFAEAPLRNASLLWGLLALLLGGGFYGLIAQAIPSALPPPAAAAPPLQGGNVQALAAVLFQKYLLPFEVVSVLILVAIIGAVILTKKRAS